MPATDQPGTTLPITDADRSVTGSTPDETIPVVTRVRVASVIAELPIEIVAVGNGRRLLRLDVASGRLIRKPVVGQPFGRPRLILGDDWIRFPTSEPGSPSMVIGSDGETGAFRPRPRLRDRRRCRRRAVAGVARFEGTETLVADDLIAIETFAVRLRP